MSLSKLVAKALMYLGTVRNYSATTLDTYQASFDQFSHFLHAHRLPDDPRQFTGDLVFRFVEDLAAKKKKPSTIVMRLNGLSTIATTLMKLKDARGRPLLPSNPTKTFEWPTPDTAETKWLLPDEMAAFLAVARPLRESIARDLLVDTGLRCSELCRANVGDLVTVEGKTALAVTVKGRGRRLRKHHTPLSTPVAGAVYDYLMKRGIANVHDPRHRDEPLLLATGDRRWQRTGLSGLMVRIGQAAGITRLRVSSHKLRHNANVLARLARLDDGSPLDRYTRSRLNNQSNPASQDRYDHLMPYELFEAAEARHRALVRYIALREDPPPP